MGVFQNLQALLPAPVGMNGITCVHEAVHMDAAGEQDRKHCQNGPPQDRPEREVRQQGKGCPLCRSNHEAYQGQKTNAPAHALIVPFCLRNGDARI